MIHSRFPRFILFLLFIFAVLVPLGFIIMALWNNVLAIIFPITVINFWQALGLFLLSRILFGGFPGRPGWAGRGHNRREMEAMRNKWLNMTPEERQHFKQDWRNRCGARQTPVDPESTATE
jgi:hypothetical protein